LGVSRIEKKLAATKKNARRRRRTKEEEAEMARKRLKTNTTANIMMTASDVASAPSSAFGTTTAPSTTTGDDTKEISKLRGSLPEDGEEGHGLPRGAVLGRIEVPGHVRVERSLALNGPRRRMSKTRDIREERRVLHRPGPRLVEVFRRRG
jgi:hypothetical protein